MTGARKAKRPVDVAAESYRARGYDVDIEPGAGELPRFLANVPPGLVARRDGENIAVVVRSRDVVTDDWLGDRIREAIAAHPDWRLQYFLPRPEKPDGAAHRLTPDEAATRLSAALRLSDAGDHEAALLLACAAAAALLHELADDEDLPLDENWPVEALGHLGAHGTIDGSDYDVLMRRFSMARALACGYAPRALDTTTVPVFIDRLSASLRAAAATRPQTRAAE